MIFLIMTLVVGITSFAQTKFRELSWEKAVETAKQEGKMCLLISMRIGAGLAR